MIVDDLFFLRNRHNLMKRIHMQLSQKQKNVFGIFLTFLKFKLKF